MEIGATGAVLACYGGWETISMWGSEASSPIRNRTNPESLNNIDDGRLRILEYNCVSNVALEEVELYTKKENTKWNYLIWS